MDNYVMKNILVVDDEDAYRGLVQRFLQSLDYACEVASDAFEALSWLHQKTFELVITDLRMPGQDGVELAREALREYPHLAVMIMTGHASDYSYSDIVKAGVSDFITKPFEVGELKAKIERIERERLILHDLRCTNEDLQQEIAERRQVEEKLGESERRFREILENVYLLAVSLDPAGRIIFCNDFFLSVAGWQRVELLGRDWFEVCLPPDSQRMMRSSYFEEIALGEITAHGEDEIITCLGKRCLVAWNNTLLRDPQGKVIGVTKIGRDVGQRRKMQKELREASAEMELLIASIPSILMELSENNRVTRWNSASERTFGPSSAEVLGVPLDDCALRWDWEKVHGSLLACRKERTAVRADDVRFVRSDGKEGLLGLTISPIQSELGELLGFIILGADISERRLMERQLTQAQKLESIGQLAAGIAHEINTPTQYVGDNTRFLRDAFHDLEQLLETYAGVPAAIKAGVPADELITAMNAAAEEADLEYLKDEIPRAIHQSLEGVERVSKIVAAMKEFSHPGVAEKTAIDINRAIESTVTVARNEWKYVAELVMDLDHSMPPVPCLPGEFNQVVLNIIINAAHALGASMAGKESGEKGTITVCTHNLGDHAEIRISDTGTGIPESIRPRIFDPFFTTKDVGKGTGQGLAIAHSVIVDKHGGTLRFESEMGRGTTFIISLPNTSLGEPGGDRA
jgi:PAS domain S-box-containing protein